MSEQFSTLGNIIRSRRTSKTAQMNGRAIPDEQVQQLLELADWAPTHGLTEPWRFTVYSGEKAQEFCRSHADFYKSITATENFLQANYDKIATNGDKVSHIIVAVMQRGHLPKIPAWEELAAASCAVEHILLGATALGIASMWSTGGMTNNPAFKTFLQLREEDAVLGIIYLGYCDTPPAGRRTIPLEQKVTWVK